MAQRANRLLILAGKLPQVGRRVWGALKSETLRAKEGEGSKNSI
jgi:hypothetical protein